MRSCDARPRFSRVASARSRSATRPGSISGSSAVSAPPTLPCRAPMRPCPATRRSSTRSGCGLSRTTRSRSSRRSASPRPVRNGPAPQPRHRQRAGLRRQGGTGPGALARDHGAAVAWSRRPGCQVRGRHGGGFQRAVPRALPVLDKWLSPQGSFGARNVASTKRSRFQHLAAGQAVDRVGVAASCNDRFTLRSIVPVAGRHQDGLVFGPCPPFARVSSRSEMIDRTGFRARRARASPWAAANPWRRLADFGVPGP